jgi:phenylpropionate dioxygenase-like ring-hydroxylating dioxygenase large terminal subunit
MLSEADNELLTRVAPGTPMGALFRRFWLPIMLQRELPGPDSDPIRVRLLGEDLVAFRDSQGQIGFLAAHCPHRGASLFFGRNEEAGLRCVYHGWKFDAHGNCLDMPNEPAESDFKHKVKATAYPAAEHGGLIWIYMGPSHLHPELPQMEWTHVPDSHRWLGKTFIESNYVQSLEAGQDPSHSSFLHRWFTVSDMPNKRNFDLSAYTKDGAPQQWVQETDYGFIRGARRDRGDGRFHWKVGHLLLPSYNTLAPPQWPHIGNMWVPVDDEHTYQFWHAYHYERPLTDEETAFYGSGTTQVPRMIPGTFQPVANHTNDYLIDRTMQKNRNFTGLASTGTEDIAMAESMGRIVDRRKEHLGSADLPIIVMRQILLRMARALEQGIEPYAATHGDIYRVRPLCVDDPEGNFQRLLEQYDGATVATV